LLTLNSKEIPNRISETSLCASIIQKCYLSRIS